MMQNLIIHPGVSYAENCVEAETCWRAELRSLHFLAVAAPEHDHFTVSPLPLTVRPRSLDAVMARTLPLICANVRMG
jgi:hypothetical protein